MSFLEKEILGSFLKDNSLLQETILVKEHFNEKHHQKLFEIMQKMSRENKAIDKVTLLAESYNFITELGGPAYITDLETNGNTDHFETYERELISRYKTRTTEKIVKEWLANDKKDRRFLVDELERIDEEGETEEVNTMSLLMELYQEVDRPTSDIVTGIPSGLEALDTLTSGWQPETSIILGARPSMGKTALMLKFALSAAQNGDVPVIFSLEMSAKSLLRRMATALGNINGFEARNPQNMEISKQKKWMDAITYLSELDFEIYDHSYQTIQYIRSKVRKAQKKYKGKRIIAMIDYLTLIENAGSFPSEHAKYSDVSRKLKAMAKDYQIPVITLAQLSRGVEQRADKRPLPSDLRESGSIEQDADLILLLYRESYYKKDYEFPHELEINLAKQRDGATGQIKVNYYRSTGVIRD